MSPTAHWSEADYYRASRGARAAWQKTSQQLALEVGLDSGEVSRADDPGCGLPCVEPAGNHPLPAAGSPPMGGKELLQSIVGELRDVAATVGSLGAVADQIESALRSARPRAEQVERREVARQEVAPVARPPARRPAPPTAEAGDPSAIGGGERKILESLASHYPMRVSNAMGGAASVPSDVRGTSRKGA